MAESLTSAQGARVLLPHQLTLRVRGGSAGSIVMLHGVGGTVRFMEPLADALAALPVHVYLVQARGLFAHERPVESIGAMSEGYARMLAHAAPPGPLMLCGYSLGCVVVLETTRRLRAAGWDCKAPFFIAPTPSVRQLDAPAVHPDLAKLGVSVDKLMRGFQQRERVALAADAARRFHAVYTAHLLAGMRHHCAVAGEDLVCAVPADEPPEATAKMLAAWTAVCRGRIVTIPCAGAHETLAHAAELPGLVAGAFLNRAASNCPTVPESPR